MMETKIVAEFGVSKEWTWVMVNTQEFWAYQILEDVSSASVGRDERVFLDEIVFCYSITIVGGEFPSTR